MTERLSALNSGGLLDFCANKIPKCRHCGDDFDITGNEAWFLYDENETHDVECPRCNIAFSVNASAQWSFSTDEQEDEA